MTRFEQRLQTRLKNQEFAIGYRDMGAELDLLQAIDDVREQLQVSKEELAARIGHEPEPDSESADGESSADATINTVTALLSALGITADITLRRAADGEAPIKVTQAL